MFDAIVTQVRNSAAELPFTAAVFDNSGSVQQQLRATAVSSVRQQFCVEACSAA